MSDTSSRIPNKSVYTVTPTAQIGLSLWNTRGDAEKSYKSVNEKVGLKANVDASEKIDVYVAASAAFSQSSKNLEQPSTDGVKTAVVNTVGAEYEQGVAFKLGDATSLSLGTYAEAGVANGTAPLLAGSSSLVDLKGYHGVGLSTAFAYHSEKSTISLVGKFGGRSYSFHKANSFVSATTGLNWGLGINWSGQVKRKDNEELQEDLPSASLEERDPIVEPEGTTPTPMAAAPVAAEPIEPTPAAAAEPVAVPVPAAPAAGVPAATPEPTPAAAATPPTSSATTPPAAAKPAAPVVAEAPAPAPAPAVKKAVHPNTFKDFKTINAKEPTFTVIETGWTSSTLKTSRTQVGYVAIPANKLDKAAKCLSGEDISNFKKIAGANSGSLVNGILTYTVYKTPVTIKYAIKGNVTFPAGGVKVSWSNVPGDNNSFTQNNGYWQLEPVKHDDDPNTYYEPPLYKLTWNFTTIATFPDSQGALVNTVKKSAGPETAAVFKRAISVLSSL